MRAQNSKTTGSSDERDRRRDRLAAQLGRLLAHVWLRRRHKNHTDKPSASQARCEQ